MAIRLADTARPNNYVDAEHKGTFPVAYAEDIWFEDGTRLSEKSFDGQSIQKEELPLASADELGNIYQYIGNTTFSLTNGRFYKCVSNGGSTPVYSWEETEVSRTYKTISRNPAGGSSGLDAGFLIRNFIDVTDSASKEINSYLLTLINNVNNSISIILQTTYDDYLGYGVKAIAIEDNNNMIEKIPKFVYNDTQKYIFFILPRSWRQQDTTISLMQIGGKKMDFRLVDASGEYTGANVTIHNVENLKKTFTGTQAEWDALTTDKKKTYNIVNITDDESNYSLFGQRYISDNVVVTETSWTSKTFTFNTSIPKGKYLIGVMFESSDGTKSVYCSMKDLIYAYLYGDYSNNVSLLTSEVYTQDTDGTVSLSYNCAINVLNISVKVNLVLIKIG